MDRSLRRFLSGVWLPVVGVVAYAVAGSLAVYGMRRFGFPFDQPGSNPPWYFIRRDYIQGIAMASLGVPCVLLGLVCLRRHPVLGGMLVWQSLIGFGDPVWKILVILLRTDYVMDASSATTAWPTLDAYVGEPLLWYGQAVILVLALLIAMASVLVERMRASDPVAREAAGLELHGRQG